MPEIGDEIQPGAWMNGPQVPDWLACRKEISAGAKLLYARLYRYGAANGDWFASLDTLAASIGASRRTVVNWMGELTTHQLVTSVRRGLGRTNKYAFLYHPWIDEWQPDQECSPCTSADADPATPSTHQVLRALVGRPRRDRPKTLQQGESLPDPEDASMPVLGASPRRTSSADSPAGRPDSGAGLARHFARTARQNLTVDQLGPGPFNHSRLAAAFAQWKREGFDSERIRIMIDLYLRPDHRRPPGKSLWLGLLAQRTALDAQAKRLHEASRPAAERYSDDYTPKSGTWGGKR